MACYAFISSLAGYLPRLAAVSSDEYWKVDEYVIINLLRDFPRATKAGHCLRRPWTPVITNDRDKLTAILTLPWCFPVTL